MLVHCLVFSSVKVSGCKLPSQVYHSRWKAHSFAKYLGKVNACMCLFWFWLCLLIYPFCQKPGRSATYICLIEEISIMFPQSRQHSDGIVMSIPQERRKKQIRERKYNQAIDLQKVQL